MEVAQLTESASQRDSEHAVRLRELETAAQEHARTKEELRKCRALIAKYEEEIKQGNEEMMKIMEENERLVKVMQEQEIMQQMYNEAKGKMLQKDAEVRKLQVWPFFLFLGGRRRRTKGEKGEGEREEGEEHKQKGMGNGRVQGKEGGGQ